MSSSASASNATWNDWSIEWAECRKCPIGRLAHRHVLGDGLPSSKIVLIGEGPGKSEDVLGVPFVGEAGKLLTRMLLAAELPRSAVYITNLVACRPCDALGGPNRQPNSVEVTNCQPRLKQLFRMIRPVGVILVGKPAALYGTELLKDLAWDGLVCQVTHPAFFLRNGGPKSKGYPEAVETLRVFWKEVKNGKR